MDWFSGHKREIEKRRALPQVECLGALLLSMSLNNSATTITNANIITTGDVSLFFSSNQLLQNPGIKPTMGHRQPPCAFPLMIAQVLSARPIKHTQCSPQPLGR